MKRSILKREILPKSPERVVKIATAKSKRSFKNPKLKWSSLWEELPDSISKGIELEHFQEGEIGYFLYWRTENEWTALSSHAIFGCSEGKFQRVELKKVKDYDFGVIKGLKDDINDLKISTKFKNYRFKYEVMTPGFYLLYGFEIFVDHWKNSALEN